MLRRKENMTGSNPEPQPDWNYPQPEKMPQPSYAPVGLAFGAVFLLWGVLTSYIVSIAGLIIFVASLAAWIGVLRHG